MKLLIITQKVNKNDPILGFFHAWIKEFSKNVENLTVICLEKGEYDLPENVKVLSLGKEKGTGKIGKLFRFYKYIWNERKNYDKVFVHMNQIYVIFGGFIWRMFKKEIGIWYAHGQVSLTLKIAENLAHIIFTSTPQGFRLKSKKLNIVGQGIDTDLFKPISSQQSAVSRQQLAVSSQKKILTVGRISKAKRIDAILDAIKLLPNVSLEIVGDSVTEDDKVYKKYLEGQIIDLGIEDRVKWLGSFSNTETVPFYQNSDVFVNVSETGSLDKTILEAIACGVPVVSSNDSAVMLEGVYRTSTEARVLAHEIALALESGALKEGREMVVREHSLEGLVRKILNIYVF